MLPAGVNFTALLSRLTGSAAVFRRRPPWSEDVVELLGHQRVTYQRLDRATECSTPHELGFPRLISMWAGLDLREVEDGIDQREQVLTACQDLSGSRTASPRPPERRITMRVKPMIALSGVRSSCDMLARNSDL